MSVASSEYSHNPLSTITNQFSSQMNATPGQPKKSKINRKRGFNEIDLPFDDQPPSKKHRLNSKKADNKIIESTSNGKDNNQENKENISQASLTTIKRIGKDLTSLNVNSPKKEKSTYKTNSVNVVDDNDNDEEEEEEEDIDIDIDMTMKMTMKMSTNKNNKNNKKNGDYMECDEINCGKKSKSALGDKAKNIHDYSPKIRRSGLMFLIQCGIGFNKSK